MVKKDILALIREEEDEVAKEAAEEGPQYGFDLNEEIRRGTNPSIPPELSSHVAEGVNPSV